jgi:predicted pyridoxine 5'-phosphate oxidase superfamily flavin-nucleotide-binding protein
MGSEMGHEKRLTQALELAADVRTILVATADGEGRPHLAVAGKILGLADGRVAVFEWFCPGTVANLEKNPRISLVVWDPGRDIGYQLVGEAERVEDVAFLDGHLPELESVRPVPQTQRRITVRVTGIMAFSRAPHTDEPG